MAPAALQHRGFSPALVVYVSDTTGSNPAVKPVSYQPCCGGALGEARVGANIGLQLDARLIRPEGTSAWRGADSGACTFPACASSHPDSSQL